MLLAVAGPARGRSHTSRTGNDGSDLYGYYDSRLYSGHDNSSGNPFGSIFDECDHSDYSEYEPSTTHYILLGLCPLLLLQGIVGNLLAIPTLVSISRSAWSTVLYLACLGGVDLLLLLVQCGDAWYQEIVKKSLSRKILYSSDAACKTYHFAYTCVKHLSPWLMVAVSIEMMIATRWPKKTYFMCTLERARNVMMLMGIIIVCLDINHFWTYGVIKPGVPCMYIEEFTENFREWIWPVLDNAVELIMPVTTVSICFFLTATTLIHRPANRKRDLDTEMKNYFLELDSLRDFTNICFILCVVFMCLSACKITCILTMMVTWIGYVDLDCQTLRVFKTIDMTFTFVFFSAKIYLYIAFSGTFRAKLKQGFVSGYNKLQRCCRIVCLCRHKWAPVTPQDKCDDARMLQRASIKCDDGGDSQAGKGCQGDGRNSGTGRCGANSRNGASDRDGEYRESPDKGGGGTDQEWHGNDASELASRRPVRGSGGMRGEEMTATKV